jgi:hypothetical protein
MKNNVISTPGVVEIPSDRAMRLAGRTFLVAGPAALIATGVCLVFLPATWAVVVGWTAVAALFVSFVAAVLYVAEFVYVKFPLNWKYGPRKLFWTTVFNPEVIGILVASPMLFGAKHLVTKLPLF